jgi:hypothetical protein
MYRKVTTAGPPQARQHTSYRWRHPFDSASGTIVLGVLLTVVLVAALRLLSG